MIYTIGHKVNYLNAIEKHGTIQKLGKKPPGDDPDYPNGYPGGYAFRTLEDARRGLVEEDKHGTWAIFGIDADWEQDTEPSNDGWYHHLIRDADIVPLNEEGNPA